MNRVEQVRTGLREFFRGALDLALPNVCPGCRAHLAETDSFCDACAEELLKLVVKRYCPRCGTTCGENLAPSEDGCAWCPQPLPRFGQVIRLGPYGGPLRAFIRRLKYRRREAGLGQIGRMLARACEARCQPPHAVVAIPTPWRRRVWRGHDHARALAGEIARQMGLPLGDDLKRVRSNPPQARLSRAARQKNVRGCFAVRRGSQLHGAHLLLVDDVTTTGATANEAAWELKKAGADIVTLVVIAKTDPKPLGSPTEGI